MADARALPFVNDSFDLAFSLDVLEHINKPILALQEIVRVSNSEGHFLTYAVSSSNRFKLEWLQRKLLLLFGVDLHRYSSHHPDLLVDPEKIGSYLRISKALVERFQFFHSFASCAFDQPLLVAYLLLKKLGVFSLGPRVQRLLGQLCLALASLAAKLAFNCLVWAEKPTARRRLSNGFIVLGRKNPEKLRNSRTTRGAAFRDRLGEPDVPERAAPHETLNRVDPCSAHRPWETHHGASW